MRTGEWGEGNSPPFFILSLSLLSGSIILMRTIFIIFFILNFNNQAHSENIFQSMSIGGDFGGNLDFMISDQQTQAFGIGLGTHWGFYTVTNRKTSLNYKLSIESVFLREETMGPSSSDYLVPATHLKSLGQNLFIIAPGIEYRIDKGHYQFFYEAFLGYGIGGAVKNYVKSTVVDGSITEVPATTNSTFILGGGFGFKKRYQNRFSLFTSLRTLFMFAKPFQDAAYDGKSLLPLPFLFSLGLEYQL